jgi:hypothetical protein
MTENAPYEKIEREMNSMFTRETVPEPFVCTLRAQLNQKIEQRVSKKRRPFFMRPVWIGLSGLILVMVISTLVIPQAARLHSGNGSGGFQRADQGAGRAGGANP